MHVIFLLHRVKFSFLSISYPQLAIENAFVLVYLSPRLINVIVKREIVHREFIMPRLSVRNRMYRWKRSRFRVTIDMDGGITMLQIY